MKHEFRAGDLAIIKHCATLPALIGRCVELVAAVPPQSDTLHDGRLYSNTSPDMCWLITHPEGFPVNSYVLGLLIDQIQPIALFRESLLMPLRGDEQPDATLATSTPRQAVTA